MGVDSIEIVQGVEGPGRDLTLRSAVGSGESGPTSADCTDMVDQRHVNRVKF